MSSWAADVADDWFKYLKARNPWLDLVVCRRCGQHWYLATDTVDDERVFMKLSDREVGDILTSDKWPTMFDTVANVWPESSPK